MYVSGKRGVGAVVPVPFSTWGYVGGPCSSPDGSMISAMADSSGISSSTLSIGALILGGVLLYAAFGGGR